MTLPTAPSRTMDQDTFDSTTDAFIGALPQFETDMNALAAAMALNSTTDTSATSNSIGTGAKTFTVSASKSFWPGMWLVIADTAAPTANAMFCQVTSYSGTTLAVNSYSVIGSGTKTAWSISQSAPASLDGLYATFAQDFRISLTTGVPVTTADVVGATTIYAVPKTGNRIALYNGTTWVNYTSAEFSLALGTLTNNLSYDVFCYQNAGVPTLELLAWTDLTTRATALAYDSGVLIKSGNATRRYLCTIRTSSTTTTEDSVTKRYVDNYYHREWREMRAFDTTNSWTYTTDTFRQANNSASNQFDFVVGVAGGLVTANVLASASSDATNPYIISGIGLDSTTASSANSPYTTARATYPTTALAAYSGTPAVGGHYLAWLERSQAAGTTTWYGDSGLTGVGSAGIYGGKWG